MATTLRAYDRNGNRLSTGPVPWSSLTRTIVRNAPGSIATTVPLSLITSGLLDAEVFLRVAEDGIEAPDWYVLDDDGDDPADEGGEARDVSIGGKGALKVFDWAEVYPWDHVPGGTLLGLTPTHPFNTTPGGIMAELIDRAQARGALPMVDYSFTATHDSAGTPWPSNFAKVYDAGTTLLKVLEGFAGDAWADFEMTGFTLDLYVPDTELAQDFPDTVLYLGQGVTQAPRKRTRDKVRSVILATGNEGAIIEVSDPDAVARYGRREGFEGRGSITDIGTLTAATQVSLARQTAASESITLTCTPGEVPPIPRPGGYIRYDQRRLSPTQLEPMRVQSIAWDYGEDPKISVELADLWLDRDIRMERRIDAILNGSSANERVPLPPLGDETPPSPVQGLSLVSAPYEDPTTGQQYAQVTATWMQVTTDVDGTPVGELAGYTIEWRQLEVGAGVRRVGAGAGATLTTWSPVVPGTPIEARIAAFDRWGNYSTWSPWVQIMAGVDQTPPPTPTVPAVDNYLGLLRATWDGGFVGGSARPADLHRIEVHVSAVNGFDPNTDPDATLVGTLVAPGPVFVDTPYGVDRFVRLVAVDTTGNRSAASAQASGATGPVVSADVFDGAIGSSKLADLAVVTAKIADLAVNNAKIGSMEVGKLTAGTMTAQVVMGGRIATGTVGTPSSPTAPVVELNSLGIFRYSATGDATVAIDSNGALLTGTYKTATTGRRIEMGAAGTEGRITFWSPTSDEGFIRSYTQSNGVESIQIGMHPKGDTRVDPLWNLLNINTSSNGEYALLRSGTLEFIYDTNGVNSSGSFVVFGTTDRGVGPARLRFQVRDAASGYYVITGGSAENAPTFQSMNGNGIGGGWRFVGNASGSRWESTWYDVSGYIPVWASAFTVSSDRRGKRDIRDLDPADSHLAAVRSTRVRRYRRADRERIPRVVRDADGTERTVVDVVDAPEEIGLIAQEAPSRIVSGDTAALGIDQYQMATMLWRAVQELADTVDDLQRGRP